MFKNLIIFGIFVLASVLANAQIFYSPITEKQYNKIVIGDLFYEGQIQLIDGTWHKGKIARIPDSNKLRFKSNEDTVRVFTLSDKYVQSFCYNLVDSFPMFIFKEIPVTKKKSEKIIVEAIILGELNLYIDKTVEKITYKNQFLQTKNEFQMLINFYVEKNNQIYYMEDFEKDLVYLIRDKELIYDSYRKTKKNRRYDDFKDYINVIIQYNATDVKNY